MTYWCPVTDKVKGDRQKGKVWKCDDTYFPHVLSVTGGAGSLGTLIAKVSSPGKESNGYTREGGGKVANFLYFPRLDLYSKFDKNMVLVI